jgi:excisionase family DNA binding protein
MLRQPGKVRERLNEQLARDEVPAFRLCLLGALHRNLMALVGYPFWLDTLCIAMTTDASNDQSELMTVGEVARLCQIHEVTVRRHIRNGRLRAVRIGRSLRVRRDDFERYVEDEPTDPRRDWKPLAPDDPIFRLIGIASVPEAADVSSNKHAALADVYAPEE